MPARSEEPVRLQRQTIGASPGLEGRGACACGGGCPRCAAGALLPKLAISTPGDPFEREADRVAAAIEGGDVVPEVARTAALVQRRCACGGSGEDTCTCEDDPAILSRSATSEAPSHAPPSVSEALRGGGVPLDPGTRADMESRFGSDFEAVRVHTGALAMASAADVGALAYTVGSNVVFGAGQYRPHSPAGRRLLAHELTHVVQQGRGSPPALRRKLKVDKPADKIPNPGGKGLVQTNGATIESYLASLCGAGKAKVDSGTGVVSLDKAFCKEGSLPKGIAGPVAPSPAQASSTPAGCGCLCDMIASANDWTIMVDDGRWPQTAFTDDDAANGKKPGGSGGVVTAPSPNSTKLWGAGTASGKTLDIDPWLVLGHELCGHGWLGNAGKHAPDEVQPRGEGGHQATVARENLIRGEHGIEARGTFKEPNCGESYFRDKAAPGKVNWSRYRAVCEAWRNDYNKKNGTSYKITDKIP